MKHKQHISETFLLTIVRCSSCLWGQTSFLQTVFHMTNSRFWWSFSHAYSRITGDTEPAGKPDRQTFSPLLFGPSWRSFWRHDLKHVLHLAEWSLKRLNQAVTVPLHSCGIKKKKKTLPKTSLPKRQAHYSETGGWRSSWGKYCVQVVCLMLVISFWEATLFLWSHEKKLVFDWGSVCDGFTCWRPFDSGVNSEHRPKLSTETLWAIWIQAVTCTTLCWCFFIPSLIRPTWAKILINLPTLLSAVYTP